MERLEAVSPIINGDFIASQSEHITFSPKRGGWKGRKSGWQGAAMSFLGESGGQSSSNPTPKVQHGTWKWYRGIGDSFWKPSILGSMLKAWGVYYMYRSDFVLNQKWAHDLSVCETFKSQDAFSLSASPVLSMQNWVVVLDTFYFHPEHWGNGSISTNIFQMGWFNHQLENFMKRKKHSQTPKIMKKAEPDQSFFRAFFRKWFGVYTFFATSLRQLQRNVSWMSIFGRLDEHVWGEGFCYIRVFFLPPLMVGRWSFPIGMVTFQGNVKLQGGNKAENQLLIFLTWDLFFHVAKIWGSQKTQTQF